MFLCFKSIDFTGVLSVPFSIASCSNVLVYTVLSAVSVLIRPTGAVLWVPLLLFHWYWKKTHRKALVKTCLLVGWVSYVCECSTVTLLMLCIPHAGPLPRHGQWLWTEFSMVKLVAASFCIFCVSRYMMYFSLSFLPLIRLNSLPFSIRAP